MNTEIGYLHTPVIVSTKIWNREVIIVTCFVVTVLFFAEQASVIVIDLTNFVDKWDPVNIKNVMVSFQQTGKEIYKSLMNGPLCLVVNLIRSVFLTKKRCQLFELFF